MNSPVSIRSPGKHSAPRREGLHVATRRGAPQRAGKIAAHSSLLLNVPDAAFDLTRVTEVLP